VQAAEGGAGGGVNHGRQCGIMREGPQKLAEQGQAGSGRQHARQASHARNPSEAPRSVAHPVVRQVAVNAGVQVGRQEIPGRCSSRPHPGRTSRQAGRWQCRNVAGMAGRQGPAGGGGRNLPGRQGRNPRRQAEKVNVAQVGEMRGTNGSSSTRMKAQTVRNRQAPATRRR